MKIFSLSLGATLFVGASAYHFDYSATPSGSDKCALINVVMDESGSMSKDQGFMKDTALPRMARELHSNLYGYKHVFICSTGFSDYYTSGTVNYARDLGCSTYDSNGVILQSQAVDWRLTGGFEDGWHGLMTAIDSVPDTIEGLPLLTTCNRIDKNLILVSDEDRDVHSSELVSEVKAYIDTKGYVLNAVVNIKIDADNNNLGMKIGDGGSESRIFRYDSANGGYTNFTRSGLYTDYVSDFGTTHADYSELIVDTNGAIWNIQALRAGNALANAFADAFVDVKVKEISTGCGARCEGGSGGDPHITTWHNEHYEYHGQCDLAMMNDPNFAEGKGLDIHIRTKTVRFWSYIKEVAIKIGNDILEIEGSPDTDDAEAHYWINFEYQGELESIGGFPVTQKLPSTYKREYTIDLGFKYPGQKIVIKLYKEFVRVAFTGDEQVFGNTVGLLGDFKTGKTLGRDGVTVINDFTELGDEWQVLPAEPKLFHEVSHPQFPELCIKPEDPRGERKRRLAESTISVEQAEAACAPLKDPLSIKDCVYDILATQDLDMVGAF